MRTKQIDAWKITCMYPEEKKLHGKLKCLGSGWIDKHCRQCEWSKFSIAVTVGRKK